MRRFLTIAMSLSVLLGLVAAGRLSAQEPKTDEPAPAAKPEEAKPAEAPKADEAKAEEPAAEAPLPTIPPEVEAKLEAARKAVAEAIVAAQDAKLVETTINPPPVLDILFTGRALDARDLKARKGVSPEVFGAWFTGYGSLEGITPQSDVRIVHPSKGLQAWYDQRANILNRYIDAARKAKDAAGTPEAAPADTPAPAPTPEPAPAPTEEPKPEAPKAEEPKAEEAPKAEEPKAEEPKAEEAPKAEEPKAEEAPKAEEPKVEAPQS